VIQQGRDRPLIKVAQRALGVLASVLAERLCLSTWPVLAVHNVKWRGSQQLEGCSGTCASYQILPVRICRHHGRYAAAARTRRGEHDGCRRS